MDSSPAQSSNAPTALPPVTVIGGEDLPREDSPVGPYSQPGWTAQRRFPSTRVYLQRPQWNTGFEQWVGFHGFRGGAAETRFQEEFEMGLPYRSQLRAGRPNPQRWA